jgi:hypothetical protein
MAQKHYVLDEEFKRAVQQVVRQFMNSWYPGTLGKRRRVAGGGGTGDTLDAIFAVCSEEIGAATGTIAEITPGTGKAWLYETEPTDGVRTRAESGEEFVEVEVRHYDPNEGYDLYAPLYLVRADFSDGVQYYETVSPSCGTFPEE